MKEGSRSEIMRQVGELDEIPDGIQFDSRKVWKKLEIKLQEHRSRSAIIKAERSRHKSPYKKMLVLLVIGLVVPVLFVSRFYGPLIRPESKSIGPRLSSVIQGNISNIPGLADLKTKKAVDITVHPISSKKRIIELPPAKVDSTSDNNVKAVPKIIQPRDSNYIKPDTIEQIAVKPKYNFRIGHVNTFQMKKDSLRVNPVKKQEEPDKKEQVWYVNTRKNI